MNSAGRPVQGAKVVVKDRRYYNSDIVLHSDGNDLYRAQLPREPSSWLVTGRRPGADGRHYGGLVWFDNLPEDVDQQTYG
ncbi:hypothetical protein [Nonomuraea sp. NPDC049758]|uniref:hypothetical protein n=1 Tax=Nonomuraea sp. NPDC049758 TaxID=3154360 RepID=UPI003415AD8E